MVGLAERRAKTVEPDRASQHGDNIIGLKERKTGTTELAHIPEHVLATVKKYSDWRDRFNLPPKYPLLQGAKACIKDGVADFDALDWLREKMYGTAEQNFMHGDINRREWKRRTWRVMTGVLTFYDHLSGAFTDPAVAPALARFMGVKDIKGATGAASERLHERYLGKGMHDLVLFDPAGDKKDYRRYLLGNVNPESHKMDEYKKHGGYKAVDKVLEMNPAERSAWIIKQVTDAGLVGWGGALVKAGLKWSTIAGETTEKLQQEGKLGPDERVQKVLVINADEGEMPDIGKDRAVMELNPHALIEGALLTAMAIAGSEGDNAQVVSGNIYIRGDYLKAKQRLEDAIEEARTAGYLYDPKTGRGKVKLDLIVYPGAGSYVCGNASSLLKSMTGERPRSERLMRTTLFGGGINGHPTLVNNVETIAFVPSILKESFEGRNFRDTATAIAGVSGDCRQGLIEIPRGLYTARDLFETYGGVKVKDLQAYQAGGSSTPLTEDFDIPLDVDTLKAAGNSWGTKMMGGLDRDTNIPELVGKIKDFNHFERCHGCPDCFGTELRDELATEHLRAGKGTKDDMEYVIFREGQLKKEAGCGLGQSALIAFASWLKKHPEQFGVKIN